MRTDSGDASLAEAGGEFHGTFEVQEEVRDGRK